MGGGAEEESTTCDWTDAYKVIGEATKLESTVFALFSFRRIEFGSRG